MQEVKHYKVKTLPSLPNPNSIYYVKATTEGTVHTYITDQFGQAFPLIDLTGGGGTSSGSIASVTGTGVTGTTVNPIININTFLSSQLGNLLVLSSTDQKLFVKPITSPDGSININSTATALELQIPGPIKALINSALQPGANISLLTNDAGYITAAGAPASTTTANVISDVEVGGIIVNQTIASGTNLQQFVEKLLIKTYNPTLNLPTFSLSNDAGAREIGSTASSPNAFNLTFNFNAGSIQGATVGGIWLPGTSQGNRAGSAISYTINGITQSGNVLSVSPTFLAGGNNFNAVVSYGIGIQPLNSKGLPFDSPFPAGTSTVQTTVVQGIYPYFYYKSTSPITAASMQAAISSGAATKIVGTSTGTLTIPYNVTGQYMAVAYPNASTAKTKYFVTNLDAGALGNPTSPFDLGTVLSCNSSSAFWSNIQYRIHVSPLLTNSTTNIELRNP